MLGKMPFILFSLWPMLCLCQPSITRTETHLLIRNSSSIESTRYTIKNISDDTIYIWLQGKDTSSIEKPSFIRYFFGDGELAFPLSILCFDGNVYFDSPFTPVIGANFIKKLSPNESFYVYLLNCDMDPSMIHYESINNIKKIVPPGRLDEYGFIDDYVILDSVNF